MLYIMNKRYLIDIIKEISINLLRIMPAELSGGFDESATP